MLGVWQASSSHGSQPKCADTGRKSCEVGGMGGGGWLLGPNGRHFHLQISVAAAAVFVHECVSVCF